MFCLLRAVNNQISYALNGKIKFVKNVLSGVILIILEYVFKLTHYVPVLMKLQDNVIHVIQDMHFQMENAQEEILLLLLILFVVNGKIRNVKNAQQDLI